MGSICMCGRWWGRVGGGWGLRCTSLLRTAEPACPCLPLPTCCRDIAKVQVEEAEGKEAEQTAADVAAEEPLVAVEAPPAPEPEPEEVQVRAIGFVLLSFVLFARRLAGQAALLFVCVAFIVHRSACGRRFARRPAGEPGGGCCDPGLPPLSPPGLLV